MLAFAKKQRALYEIERRRGQKETYATPLPREADDLKDFLNHFYRHILFKRQAEMKEECLRYPETVGRHFKELVPNVLPYEDFWQRYYYRTESVDRVMKELEASDMAARQARNDALKKSWASATHNVQSLIQHNASPGGDGGSSPGRSSSPKKATPTRPSPSSSSASSNNRPTIVSIPQNVADQVSFPTLQQQETDSGNVPKPKSSYQEQQQTKNGKAIKISSTAVAVAAPVEDSAKDDSKTPIRADLGASDNKQQQPKEDKATSVAHVLPSTAKDVMATSSTAEPLAATNDQSVAKQGSSTPEQLLTKKEVQTKPVPGPQFSTSEQTIPLGQSATEKALKGKYIPTNLNATSEKTMGKSSPDQLYTEKDTETTPSPKTSNTQSGLTEKASTKHFTKERNLKALSQSNTENQAIEKLPSISSNTEEAAKGKHFGQLTTGNDRSSKPLSSPEQSSTNKRSKEKPSSKTAKQSTKIGSTSTASGNSDKFSTKPAKSKVEKSTGESNTSGIMTKDPQLLVEWSNASRDEKAKASEADESANVKKNDPSLLVEWSSDDRNVKTKSAETKLLVDWSEVNPNKTGSTDRIAEKTDTPLLVGRSHEGRDKETKPDKTEKAVVFENNDPQLLVEGSGNGRDEKRKVLEDTKKSDILDDVKPKALVPMSDLEPVIASSDATGKKGSVFKSIFGKKSSGTSKQKTVGEQKAMATTATTPQKIVKQEETHKNKEPEQSAKQFGGLLGTSSSPTESEREKSSASTENKTAKINSIPKPTVTPSEDHSNVSVPEESKTSKKASTKAFYNLIGTRKQSKSSIAASTQADERPDSSSYNNISNAKSSSTGERIDATASGTSKQSEDRFSFKRLFGTKTRQKLPKEKDAPLEHSLTAANITRQVSASASKGKEEETTRTGFWKRKQEPPTKGDRKALQKQPFSRENTPQTSNTSNVATMIEKFEKKPPQSEPVETTSPSSVSFTLLAVLFVVFVLAPIAIATLLARPEVLLVVGDAACGPVAPGRSLMESGEDVEAVAPWWAPLSHKERAFEMLCQGRARTTLTWTETKRGIHKLQISNSDSSSQKKLQWSRKRVRSAQVHTGNISILFADDKSEVVDVPWKHHPATV